MDLRMVRRAEVREVEQRRRAEHTRGDLGDRHLAHAVELGQVARRDARAQADHERVLRVAGDQRRDQRRQRHRVQIGRGIPIGLAVHNDREAVVLQADRRDRAGRIVVVEFHRAVLGPGPVVADGLRLPDAKQSRREPAGIPRRQGRHEQRRGNEQRGRADVSARIAVCRDQRRGQRERAQRDPEHVVEVEPEQERVAADQRAEQRADRVLAVDPARHGAEVADLVALRVEDQRQHGARQRGGGSDHRERDQERRSEEHVEGLRLAREERAQHVAPVRGLVRAEVEQPERERERPQHRRQRHASDPRKRRHREAADRDREHECRDDHRERELGRAEREAAEPDHDRLAGHRREADQQGGRAVDPRPCDGSRTAFERRDLAPARAQQHEGRSGCEIDRAHRARHAVEPQPRHQREASRERARERARRVQRVDERMQMRRVVEVARERLGQHRDRAAHQHRGGADQRRGERDVGGEGDGSASGGQRERDVLGAAEQPREEQGVDADAGLDRSVEAQQRGRPPRCARTRDELARGGAEQGVTRRESAEEDPQHRGGRLAVCAEQHREVALPRDLVGETGEPREQREQEGDGAQPGRDRAGQIGSFSTTPAFEITGAPRSTLSTSMISEPFSRHHEVRRVSPGNTTPAKRTE
jgi:hypothetical protein